LVKGSGGEIYIAPDMLPRTIFEDYNSNIKPQKSSGEVKMIFLSRFMKKKNFKWLLENLSVIKGRLEIDVYGPLEDARYWSQCQRIIEAFPKNIKIQAKGPVPHEEVLATLAKYHFFIMPTLGENFGHIFLESLAAGCPLIISDRTPWLNLEERNIGWDLSLDEPDKWVETLNLCINLDQSGYSKLSNNARNFAITILNDKKYEEDTLTVLERGLSATQ
jgi:glycosyltransferase involved in cell wall biosynthesis